MHKLPLLTITLVLLFCCQTNAQVSLFENTISAQSLSTVENEKYQRYSSNDSLSILSISSIGDLATKINDGKFSIELPNYECPIEFQYSNSFQEDSIFSWHGEAIDVYGACVSGELEIHNDPLTGEYGRFQVNDDIYEFMPISKDKSVVYKYISTRKSQVCGVGHNSSNNLYAKPFFSPSNKKVNQEEEKSDPCYANTRIKLLILYTQNAEDEDPNIEVKARLALQQAKLTIRNSRLSHGDIGIELLGIEPTSFEEGQSMIVDLNAIISSHINNIPEDFLDPVVQRNDRQADLVIIFTHSDYLGFSGFAGIGPEEATPFGIVTAGSATSRKVFTHELGHLLGGHHQDEENPGNVVNRAQVIKYGSTIPPFRATRGTAVVNTEGIPSDPKPRVPISYFSNPEIRYRGQQLGSENNNNTLVIRNSAPEIANYFPNNHTNFTSWIEGPWGPCPCEPSRYTARFRCENGPVSFLWETSTDGIIWTPVSTASFFDFTPPCDEQSLTSIRLTTDDGTISIVQSKTVGANPSSFSCLNKSKSNSGIKNTIPTVENTISIYPNPVVNLEDIKFKNIPDGHYNIRILSMSGKKIGAYSGEVIDSQLPRNTFKHVGIREGTYYAVITGKASQVIPFIIMR